MTKSNALLCCGQGLDKMQALAVNICVSQMNPRFTVERNRKSYVLSVHTYAEAAQIPLSTARKHFTKLKTSLFEAQMSLPECEVQGKGFSFRAVRWLQELGVTADGSLSINFSDPALQMLCDFGTAKESDNLIEDSDEKLANKLKRESNFTSFSLLEMLQLKRPSSVAMYERCMAEILKQSGFSGNSKKKVLSMQEIKQMSDLLDESGNEKKALYKKSSYVLDKFFAPVIEEINEKCSIDVQFVPRTAAGSDKITRGSTIAEVLLIFKHKTTNDQLRAEYDDAVNELKDFQEFYESLLMTKPKQAMRLEPGLQDAKDLVADIEKEFKVRGLTIPSASVLQAI